MSMPGFLERLLDGAAVEWVPLGEVTLPTANINWRKSKKTHRYIDLTSVDIATKSITETKEVTVETAPSRAQKLVEADDLIFATTRPTQLRYCLIDAGHAGEVVSTGYCVLRAEKSKVLPKWILHWLSTPAFKDYVESNQSGAAYPAISDAKVKEFKLPIPCADDPKKSLSIQTEIVRILDAFTKLTAELTAELVARKKQYKHYRDQLLTFGGDDVEWKTLGGLTKIKTGQSVNKRVISDNPGEFPVINSGREPLGYINHWNTENDPIGMTSRGAGVGSITWRDGKYFRGNLNYSVTIKCKETLNVRFLYHILEQLQPQIKQLCTFDGIPALNAGNLKELEIPVPSLSEQARIVAILDRFDTLTSSLIEGLPREIALRQKQYEYYRDLLLNFPQPAKMAEA